MDHQQQEQENNNVPPRGGGMFSRLRKKHPWEQDMSESGHEKPKSLGPAPSVTRPTSNIKRRPWEDDMNESGHEKPKSLGPAPSVPRNNSKRPWAKEAGEVSMGNLNVTDEDLSESMSSLNNSFSNDLDSFDDTPPPLAPMKPEAPKKKTTPPPPPVSSKPKKPAPVDKPVFSKAAMPAEPTAAELTEENKELLAIDFDRDGEALREAIAEDVLAMWEEQGLYHDMPDLRNELLKGIVETKFDALRQEQAKVLEQTQLASMPKLARQASQQRMSIITEETEDEESTVVEAASHAESLSLEEQEAMMTEEERTALHAFQVQEELEVRLKYMDTSDHQCLEASGRLGNLTENEQKVHIKDVHAFNKYKLHNALEQRVAKIFTEDHHVVSSFDEKDDEEVVEEEATERTEDSFALDVSAATVPVKNSGESLAKVRETLTTSFSTFEALLAKKKQAEDDDDEWTECEEETVVEPTPQDLKKVVADMDAKLKAVLPAEDDEESFMEYTVNETVVDVDELSEKHETVDVDALSEQREQEKAKQEPVPRVARPTDKRPVARVKSTDSSYVEMTVADDAVPDNTRRKAESDTKNVSMEALAGEPGDGKQTPQKRQSMQSFGNFPSITCSELDDDELTQITFDQTIDGVSTTQDHFLANAYLNKTSGKPKVPPSPRKLGSGSDSQHTNPTLQTLPMDESSYSQREGSLDSGSRDASTALAKSVSKILRVEIWSPKVKVVESAMERLANAASQGHNQRANISRLGGVIAIVRSMQSHPTNLKIQVSACEALAHLSVDDDTQEAIAEVGGRGAIVTAMESHPNEREVQQAACRALSNITRPREGGEGDASELSDSEEDEDGPSTGLGVVHALVAAMNKHPQDAEIQAKAFGSLANLCLDNPARLQELSDTGGLTAMTMALQKPWQNKMDQHEAISTLSILLRSLAELGSTSC